MSSPRCLALGISFFLIAVAAFPGNPATAPASAKDAAHPGSRVVVDAHNCYPYDGRWSDRINRALAAATPIAIEQDLAWRGDARTGVSTSVLSHNHTTDAADPELSAYFFEAIRPRIEQALREGNQGNWPLVTLNLDLKSEQPQHLSAIWSVLELYQSWLTTAPRTADAHVVEPLQLGPILVLTGSSDAQQAVFYDHVPVGGKLLVFGAVHAHHVIQPKPGSSALIPDPADNYRRWWNNSWNTIEAGGPALAGSWTPAKDARLRAMVALAHERGLWIRFYTLDGASRADMRCHGWLQHYNFGSLHAAVQRWQAAAAAGVDYIASDQYGELAEVLQGGPAGILASSQPPGFDGESRGSCRSYPLMSGLGLDILHNIPIPH